MNIGIQNQLQKSCGYRNLKFDFFCDKREQSQTCLNYAEQSKNQ